MVFVLGQSTTSLKQTSKCIWFIEEVLFKEKKKKYPLGKVEKQDGKGELS